MKRSLTSIVAVIALSILFMSRARAQLKLDKETKYDVLGLLTIKGFSTYLSPIRQGKGVSR